MDGTGSVTKDLNKYISKIIKVYAGKNEFSVRNSKHFVEMIKDIVVEEEETLVSYDIKALYPSVPQDEAIQVVYDELKQDQHLNKRTNMSPESIIRLFRLCVEKTYFMFNGKLYLQVNGLAMGASTSGFVADIYIYRLEKKALDTFVDPPDIWKRYVDDTFAKIKKTRVEASWNI